ncbi:MAG: hypothetical protein NTW21_15930 [Verrucomicrobia bacterium]|nr:hypothetical protein [Verrucomicrobiota bacterium]
MADRSYRRGTGWGTGWSAAGVLWVVLSAGAQAAESGNKIPWTEVMLNKPDVGGFQRDFPVEWDWLRQDCGVAGAQGLVAGTPGKFGSEVVRKVLDELPSTAKELKSKLDWMLQQNLPDSDARWLLLYAQACEARRAKRLACVAGQAPCIAFVKRQHIRPSFFGYTEGQSDAQAERHFLPGSALCLLTFEGTRGRVEELLADKGGVVRDPAVSWDGKRLAFAWKKSLDGDDYHLYELDVAGRKIRQVTSGLGVADYEPAYLPNGDFIFASTRCVQTVDCWWTEVSNLYTCDPEGSHLRRLGFDQVHTLYPQVLGDGRVVYTRWDYNDRGQVFPQPLFQMNPDGTGQTEFYGNNSWFPTTIAHARGIPGTSKVLAILCGHHSSQAGKLAVIDPTLGRQENQGVQLVSPERETPAERIDSYGQDGELFCYPFPLVENGWLVSYAPNGWADAKFGIYWMDRDGRREWLTGDAAAPCLQPVPVAARPRPPARASTVDYRKDFGTYYVQDIYQGPGLAGIAQGTIKKLRVVALEFRPAGIRSNSSGGPGGGAMISTPVAIGNGAWDVKRVLGETPVHADGSAFFMVPARTPVYFQALDERGRTVQTMRSWSTLQPGENASCVGCHESKNSAPPGQGYNSTLAMQRPPLKLQPFYGPARGFSFAKEIQPVLDRQCIRCHREREPVLAMARGEDKTLLELAPEVRSRGRDRAFSLLGDKVRDEPAGRDWSDAYLVLTHAKRDGKNGPFRGQPDGRMVRWVSSQSVPSMLPPESAGAIKSGLLELLEKKHYDVRLSREEYEKIACWIDLSVPFCGDYTEANTWNPDELKKYLRYDTKRKRMDGLDLEAIKSLTGGR